MTPMMLVQVYSETPMYGARIRAAMSSMTMTQKLLIKTVALALNMREVRRTETPTPHRIGKYYSMGKGEGSNGPSRLRIPLTRDGGYPQRKTGISTYECPTGIL
jgi:hypothetical protein